MDKLSKEQVEKIKEYGLFTGSRRFGTYDEKSDFDFVILREHFEQIVRLDKLDRKSKDLYEHYHSCEEYEEDETNFVSLKFKYDKHVINLIIVDKPCMFDAWKFATYSFLANTDLLQKFIKGKKEKDITKLFFESLKYSYIKTYNIIHENSRNSENISTPRLWGVK